tara:strand:+ start:453 stop:749 length:297 start_codon:yes stop_codon:yes gene_type:complete
MALEGEYETIHGIKLEKAFFKVIDITHEWVQERKKWYTSYTMAIFADRAARRLDKTPIEHANYRMKTDLTGGKDKENIIAICYNNFKQQNKDITFEDV